MLFRVKLIVLFGAVFRWSSILESEVLSSKRPIRFVLVFGETVKVNFVKYVIKNSQVPNEAKSLEGPWAWFHGDLGASAN